MVKWVKEKIRLLNIAYEVVTNPIKSGQPKWWIVWRQASYYETYYLRSGMAVTFGQVVANNDITSTLWFKRDIRSHIIYAVVSYYIIWEKSIAPFSKSLAKQRSAQPILKHAEHWGEKPTTSSVMWRAGIGNFWISTCQHVITGKAWKSSVFLPKRDLLEYAQNFSFGFVSPDLLLTLHDDRNGILHCSWVCLLYCNVWDICR